MIERKTGFLDLRRKLNKCGNKQQFGMLNVLLLTTCMCKLPQVYFSGIYQKLDKRNYTLAQYIEKEEYEPQNSCKTILLVSVYKSDCNHINAKFHLLELLGAHPILHISRIRVKLSLVQVKPGALLAAGFLSYLRIQQTRYRSTPHTTPGGLVQQNRE